MHKKTIRDIDLKGKTVLVRVDYNVPIHSDGSVGDVFRIKASLPTLQFLLKQKCRLVIMSHLGRPEGKPVPALSLKPVAVKLATFLNRPVKFIDSSVGESVTKLVTGMSPGDIVMLENLRFHSEEEANSQKFAKQLAHLGDIFVQDGFGVVHRAHASTDAITRFLPAVAGLLLEKEITTIIGAIAKPKRPFMAIFGGAKASDKLGLIESFVPKVDLLAIGGAIANTFLAQMGYAIGHSNYEPELMGEADRILKLAAEHSLPVILPDDVVVAAKIGEHTTTRLVDWGTYGPNVRSYPHPVRESEHTIQAGEYILDIGPATTNEIIGSIELAKTIIWNGTLGMAEVEPFDESSQYIEKELSQHIWRQSKTIIVGGGDTAAFVRSQWGEEEVPYGLISTGGGASLELMAGQKLPGVEALMNKK